MKYTENQKLKTEKKVVQQRKKENINFKKVEKEITETRTKKKKCRNLKAENL